VFPLVETAARQDMSEEKLQRVVKERVACKLFPEFTPLLAEIFYGV
jgi:hypothetical protein